MRKKPPLGIKPRHIYEQERIWELTCATNRYMLEQISIPQEWIDEYNFLTKQEVQG
jgi:hypothetical protein